MTEEPGIYDVSDSQPNEPPKFEEHLVHTSASIRITGHQQEIDLVLNALARAGFFYKTNKTLYPCRDFLKFLVLLEALWGKGFTTK
jgi:hypothetical protein